MKKNFNEENVSYPRHIESRFFTMCLFSQNCINVLNTSQLLFLPNKCANWKLVIRECIAEKSSWTAVWKCVVGYVPLSNVYATGGN
jgi:hypothetical protein